MTLSITMLYHYAEFRILFVVMLSVVPNDLNVTGVTNLLHKPEELRRFLP